MTQHVDHPPRTPLRGVLTSVGGDFLALDIAARLPTAMFPLGILLLVADRTGSYGLGGFAVAALSVGGALGGPLVGALADRFGQRAVGIAATAVQIASLTGALLLAGEQLAATLALVGMLGLANPQMGAMSRARWSVLARSRDDDRQFASTAMAFESAVDEVSFVLGPVLVGTLAAVVSPTAALGLALAIALVAQTGFAVHPTALGGRTRHAVRVGRPGLPVGPFVALLVATGSVGLVFGATQTGVAARMAQGGTDELTGLVYGLMGVGAAVTALLTTRLPARVAHETRIAVSGALLVLAGAAAVVSTTPATLAAANLLLGVALAPTLVSGYALAERLAPEGWGTTTMTALATANVVGVAAGAAIAGVLVDGAGTGAALALDCVAGVLVLLGGLAYRVLSRR